MSADRQDRDAAWRRPFRWIAGTMHAANGSYPNPRLAAWIRRMASSAPSAAHPEEGRLEMLPEPKYWGGQWHYDDASISTQIIEHALRFALDDYERANATGRYPAHPYTQGPAAIKDALAEIDSWRLRAQRILAEARSV